MTPIGNINPLSTSALAQVEQLMGPTEVPPAAAAAPGTQAGAPTDVFGSLIDGLVGAVNEKQTAAATDASKVMLGDSSQLHQSVISMQEASLAFSLMVEVRNKLVDSYQELMRMQV
jgi:flagellar hook-basal body complex protein FliE